MFRTRDSTNRTRLGLLLVGLSWLVLGVARPSAAQAPQPVPNIAVLACPGETPGPNPWNPCNWDAHQIMAEIENPHADLVTVAAHRGTHSLAGTNQAPGVPENSLDAIGIAAQEGWESIEIDVKLTSEGIPVLSHDKVWGRETCLHPKGNLEFFSPFDPEGPAPPGSPTNLLVDSTSYSFLQDPTNGAFLRDTVSIFNDGAGNSCTDPISNESPYVPTVVDVYQYIKAHNIQMVVTLDIQTPARAAGVWAYLQKQNLTDANGRPFYETTMWKIPAALFPNVASYQATFHGLQGESNSQLINFNPVLHTSGIAPAGTCMAASDIDDIDDVPETLGDAGDTGDAVEPGCPNSFGSEANMIQWITEFANSPAVNISAIEVSMKDPPPNGILSSVQQFVNTYNVGGTGRHYPISSFNPVGEYISSSDPRPQFFSSANGSCCEVLDQFLFNNPNHIQDTNPASVPYPSIHQYDHDDNRVSVDFVVNQLGAQVVTTDSPGPLTTFLQTEGKRNVSYLQATSDPRCYAGTGQYPGCDSQGTTAYTLCAPENGTCNFSGDRNVAFGANGSYTTLTFTNSAACNNATFGLPDPAFGVVKACYYSPPLSYRSGIYCADEDQFCSYNLQAAAILAANGTYYERLNSIGNGFQCNPASFGWFSDPIPGFDKACFYRPGSQGYVGPTGYTYCAPENGQCQFQGVGRVAYGANGEFNYRVLNGGVTPCNNSVFKDPAFGFTKNCWYQVTYAASGATGTSVGAPPGGSGTTSPCDIYASGGTPCVAAHSTVRALFGGYSGRLYQVQRASDGATSDIGTLSTGGYANAASQDSFCPDTTTCTITKIYDQTTQHNDLTIEGGGGAAPGADSGAVANALPITVNGNIKVYGVKVTPGVGYRDNAATGTARGASPEGTYMVTSGTYVNVGCCFDYGNVETDSHDDGEGSMDALNFGTFCEFTCSGSGPWVEADLENGQYMGNGTNLADASVGFNFVTAMLKNNGTDTFALKDGNAQSGALTAVYSGSLPTTKPGYIPMRLQGGIVLGTGGDNSNASLGSFFEGAMTSGYPTDATEQSVQSNIIAVGYNGDSSGGTPTMGSSGVTEPAGPYTGPDDPNGPGPQDGFASPAAEQPNDVMATKPAFASFNGNLYLAFQGVNVANDLYVTSSSTGDNFPFAARYTNLQSSSAPALAAFNNQLFMAFRGVNVDNDFYITASSDGVNFPTATRYTNIQMGGAPALAVFNDKLYASFQANDPNHHLFVTSSSDGVTWPTATYIPNVHIGSDTAMAVLNGKLYVAFRADDPSNSVWIASSSDGVNFSSQVLAGQTMDGNSSPALVASNGVLYYIYEANDQGHEILVTASTDGSTWQGPSAYFDVKMGITGPGAAAFGNGVTVGFQSNDSRNVLFVTNKVTEAPSYTGPNDPGGPGPQDAFASRATEQVNDVMATKPALASWNGSLFLAFQGVNVANDLYVTSSSTGTNFPAAMRYTNIQSSSAPALAGFNSKLYMAFRGLNVDNDFYITSSSDGNNFPTATRYPNLQMGGAPALAAFNNKLYASFQANDPNHHLFVTSSSDGVNWPTATYIPNVQIGSDPSMVVFNGKLYVAFRADDPSNSAFISSSPDGVNFTSQYLGQTMGGSSAPALAVSDCTLYYIYGANDQANEMLVLTSTDGTTWQGPAAYLDVQMGAAGPAASVFGNGVTVGFQSNDSRNVLFTTSGVGGLGRAPGPCPQ